MKNFILGILVCSLFSFAAIEAEIITVKPAQPKSVVVKSFSYDSEMVSFIREYTKKGYIVKQFQGNVHSGDPIVVMEKY